MSLSNSRCGYTIALLLGLLLAGCSVNPVEEAAVTRARLEHKAQEVLATMLRDRPKLQAAIDTSKGYVIGLNDRLLLGPVSGSSGVALLVDSNEGTQTYLDIDAFGVGVGLGSSGTYFLAVIKTQEALDALQRDQWLFNPSARRSLGNEGSLYHSSSNDIEFYFFSQSGAAIGAGLELTRVSVNRRLTDTGVAGTTIPNRASAYANSQGAKAPRKWPHTLPFFGQEAVDAGFNLPLPMGVSFTFASVRQNMSLTHLNVGFNGAEKIPYEFVDFGNAETVLDTTQIKVDAWLFPFMNVFAMVGKVDGSITMDVTLDGDTLLEGSGTDCTGALRPPLCFVLAGREVEFPVRAQVNPTTYGVGTVLAGGWQDWFAVLPFNITYSKPDNAVADGRSVTVTPRVGRVFKLSELGRLALFVGGNYLDSENTVDGQLDVPGTDQVLGYRIRQESKDRWNLLAGFNWDISSVLSVSAEYNGFIGSREAMIGSLVVRF
ncbi:lipid-binding SYLF domain-containing protein [Gilvimarinus japonicus]|uniref:Lipoprotein n=1 Tax=Gilvimarinus japonicus TaxID=1796469 RepID=A0ABV7HWD5_9GAMM